MPSMVDERVSVPLVRPFVLAHLAEVGRGEGKRRLPAEGSRIVAASPPPNVAVVIVPVASRSWGFSPNIDEGA